MATYFDNLLDQILYCLLPITWKHEKKMPFWGMWIKRNPLDIINKNIFHYLMSIFSKKIFI
jgi:hypothetical protein